MVVMSRLGVGTGEYRRYKKAWRSLSCGGLLSSCKDPSSAWAFVHASICVRMCLCVRACAYVCVCSGADDRGHGLHTRGTANEKEAFPLTFHGSQKQFAQWKVAKQPQCLSPEPGRRKDEIQILDLPYQAGCSGDETKRSFTQAMHDAI